MKHKISIEQRIRGWFPTDPNLSSFPAKNIVIKTKLPKGGLLFCSLFMLISISYFLEGNATGAPFLWISCILGVSLALDILVSRGKELNMKLVMGLILTVISLGGVLVNLYVFSVPSSFLTRALSLLTLALVHVPLLFAVIAYVWGKKELSKKLIGWFSLRRS
jgi:uncharacterized membrane protein YesL